MGGGLSFLPPARCQRFHLAGASPSAGVRGMASVHGILAPNYARGILVASMLTSIGASHRWALSLGLRLPVCRRRGAELVHADGVAAAVVRPQQPHRVVCVGCAMHIIRTAGMGQVALRCVALRCPFSDIWNKNTWSEGRVDAMPPRVLPRACSAASRPTRPVVPYRTYCHTLAYSSAGSLPGASLHAVPIRFTVMNATCAYT